MNENNEEKIKKDVLLKKVLSVDPNAETNTSTTITMTDGVLIPKKSEKRIVTSWRLTIFLSLALSALLIILKPDPYRTIFMTCLKGAPLTFEVTILSILGASVIGIFTGLGSVSSRSWIRNICGLYVELIRGIPLLVQLIFIYYAAGRFFHVEGLVAAVIAMSVCFGAYMGEIVRAGIQAVHKGQMEASTALGMSKAQAFRYVILPQTIKIILPAFGNEFISMLKDSSLMSTLSLTDILRRGRMYISRTFLSLETMLVVALIYLIITLLLSRLVGLMEERLRRNG